jgi:CheY-like chemotaxis protein
MTTGKPVTVLVVDDDEVDVMAVRRSFQSLHIPNAIVEANNGIEAMPIMNGIEFLDEVRSDPDLSMTVVFVLSTSNADEDRLTCYERHISGYVLKHRHGQSFVESMSMLEHYWRVVEFPVS